jgi:hypothetical protein
MELWRVKIFAFLVIEPRLNIKCGFNWAGKIEHFSKVSMSGSGDLIFSLTVVLNLIRIKN